MVEILEYLASFGILKTGTLKLAIASPVVVPTKVSFHPTAPEVPITTKSIGSFLIISLMLKIKSPSISMWHILISAKLFSSAI